MTVSTNTAPLQFSSKYTAMWRGALAISPLSIAVIPWGILAGSLAIEVGLSPLESQAMSAIVFAGAAQLVALGMIKAGIGIVGILLTTLLITSRHFLYSMALRRDISPLPTRWRLLLGFLLTDELFAIVATDNSQRHKFDPWYALGAGLSFYLSWNLATLLGVLAGKNIPNIEQWGLDFAIAATFIALIVPLIKNKSILISVLVSLVSSVSCVLLNIEAGLLISALLGMTCGTLHEKLKGERA
jgi:4-azaleucine resistance transporter AzlC